MTLKLIQKILLRFGMLFFIILCGCSKDSSSPLNAPDNGGNTPNPDPTPNITASNLAAPSLIAPPNGVQQIWSPITFSWSSVPNAVCYEARSWYYGIDGAQYTFGLLSTPCYSSTTYTSTSSLGTYSTSNGWRGKTIYWHVRACLSNNNCGPWSTTYSFKLRDN